ncbi:membrane protein insertase YidC [Oceanobacillus timonensis]|uniref:membrane protein insertase YidC n=1 Tax=Oceanobacillus timonensis TaxID=1926285 RepID=UPI0009BB0EC3|nr:membrane protein insertase YidC [Oceanobacillus timonensis]
MEENGLLTAFKKYRFIILVLLLIVVLAGCGANTAPIDGSSTGIFDHYFVYPFSLLIKKIASLFQGNYGIAIVLITIIIRFVLMPFFIRQSKNSKDSQKKMTVMKPEMDQIQQKYKGKSSTEDQMSMQRELSELYKKHDFNPVKMAVGCLPMIIQMPILIGFYYAIMRTPEIAEQSFLWFSLGETDMLFIVFAVLIYYIQSRVSLIGLDEAQRKQMAIMSFVSPVMIAIVSFNVPAALPLYWTVSGLFMILQTLIIKKYVH